jgi:Tol biopolymer transport system component
MKLAYLTFVVLVPLGLLLAQPEPDKARLLIAFTSFRDRPKHPQISLYEHDGVGQGKIIGTIDTANLRSDYRPSLTLDGKLCVFASETENQTSKIFFWDLGEKKLLTFPAINDSPNALLHPSITGQGTHVAFAAWDKAGSSTRWDVQIYDVAAKKFLEKPRFNTQFADERMPAFSGDGRFLAYASNAKEGLGVSDVWLFDVQEQVNVPLPGLNSPSLDVSPSLSVDGRLIAFASDRPGGAGGRDIYLYDREVKKLIDLPGLNSVANEQTPSLSADGRFMTFVSERFPGEGERDVFLYDRRMQKLLPTPGLNSKREDFDPCVIELR